MRLNPNSQPVTDLRGGGGGGGGRWVVVVVVKNCIKRVKESDSENSNYMM